jgi:hypothetical protein
VSRGGNGVARPPIDPTANSHTHARATPNKKQRTAGDLRQQRLLLDAGDERRALEALALVVPPTLVRARVLEVRVVEARDVDGL